MLSVKRAQIILECAQGYQNRTIAEKLGINEHTVGSWRKRFAEQGLEGLQERQGRGRRPTVDFYFDIGVIFQIDIGYFWRDYRDDIGKLEVGAGTYMNVGMGKI